MTVLTEVLVEMNTVMNTVVLLAEMNMEARMRIWRQKETGGTVQVWRKTMKTHVQIMVVPHLDMLKWMPSTG